FCGGEITNELNLEDQIEFSATEETLKELRSCLSDISGEQVQYFCEGHNINLDDFNYIFNNGFDGFRDKWLAVIDKCIADDKGLVIEVRG
ncbi:MAG: hypothetical protein MI702_02120, partial [Chlorobiales bacterium]|nr:hypothetical protein [Chlorobiales bacterium]